MMYYKLIRLLLACFVPLLVLAIRCEKDQSVGPNPLSCCERADFKKPDNNLYVLPYPPGKTYILSQSYCNPLGGHSNQLAYDFALSIGDTVCSIGSGVVKEIREDQPDNGGDIEASNHNYIMIQHEDGSVAFYAHLMQNGVLVGKNDYVQQGMKIALSGNSGNTLGFPHLHLGLYESWPSRETYDLPIVFSNCLGPLDERGGLIADSAYTAF